MDEDMVNIDNEFEKLGLTNKDNDVAARRYWRIVNDVIQYAEAEKLPGKRTRINFDIIPVYTDKYYLGRTWAYELKKIRNNLPVSGREYNNEADMAEDINKYLKPIFNEFDRTEKLLKFLIVMDNRMYGREAYPDFRKLAAVLKTKNYEYAMLILLHLKYDRVVWNYRGDFNRFEEFENIDLKKYTSFDYKEDEFIAHTDKIISYVRSEDESSLNEYMESNKKYMLDYFK